MAFNKKVVVVGGGLAGSQIAYGLQNVADVVLIDPKEYTEIPFAQLRCIVEPKVAERSVVLHRDYLNSATVVQSWAKTATATEVITTSGEAYPYDYLIIATGTVFGGPPAGKVLREERLQEFVDLNAKLVQARSVLIIGGGPVGVELAGEIVTDFPEKKVILLHAGARLLEFLGSKASKKALKWLEGKGVEVILRDRVDDTHKLHPPDYETAKHKRIKADAHFVCAGKKVGIKWVEESPLFEEKVTVEGRLQVEPTTQVKGLANVFAAGDVADFKEIKQGYLATKHAAVVVQNIQKLMKNPDDKKLAVHKVSNRPMAVVSLGRTEAVGQLPFGTILGRLAGLLKSKDLFVGKARTALGLRLK